jgi:CheY-like chemotaxis protein
MDQGQGQGQGQGRGQGQGAASVASLPTTLVAVDHSASSSSIRTLTRQPSNLSAKSRGGAKAPPPSLSFHVLIVDDSKMTRKMLRSTLKNVGCTVEDAEDGRQAVEKVQQTLDQRSKDAHGSHSHHGAVSDNGLSLAGSDLQIQDREFDVILMDFVMVSV